MARSISDGVSAEKRSDSGSDAESAVQGVMIRFREPLAGVCRNAGKRCDVVRTLAASLTGGLLIDGEH